MFFPMLPQKRYFQDFKFWIKSLSCNVAIMIHNLETKATCSAMLLWMVTVLKYWHDRPNNWDFISCVYCSWLFSWKAFMNEELTPRGWHLFYFIVLKTNLAGNVSLKGLHRLKKCKRKLPAMTKEYYENASTKMSDQIISGSAMSNSLCILSSSSAMSPSLWPF